MTASNNCAEVKVLAVAPYGPEGQRHGLWMLEVANPGWAEAAPGQFAMLRPLAWGLEPLWARPFSIHRVSERAVTFFFQVVGKGTARLAGLNPGDRLAMWGPLGQGFAVSQQETTLIVAGGIGLAPFAHYIASHPDPGSLRLLFGHHLPLACYPFAELAAKVQAWSFQDRTPADIPKFVDLVHSRMAEHAQGLILACGPTPLLKVVRDQAIRLGARAQVSLENRMACGVGACLGCVAPDGQGHLRQTCTEGPVFWAEDIAF